MGGGVGLIPEISEKYGHWYKYVWRKSSTNKRTPRLLLNYGALEAKMRNAKYMQLFHCQANSQELCAAKRS